MPLAGVNDISNTAGFAIRKVIIPEDEVADEFSMDTMKSLLIPTSPTLKLDPFTNTSGERLQATEVTVIVAVLAGGVGNVPVQPFASVMESMVYTNVPVTAVDCGTVTVLLPPVVETVCVPPPFTLYVNVYGNVPPEPVKVTLGAVGVN